MTRPNKQDYYLAIAAAVAERSTCLHHKYGAVIVKNDRIVATGYNGSPRGEKNCCDTGICYRDTALPPLDTGAATHGGKYGNCVAVHAEQNAIISAASADMQDATLYLSCLDLGPPSEVPEPCNICDRMLRNAGIAKVVMGGEILTRQKYLQEEKNETNQV